MEGDTTLGDSTRKQEVTPPLAHLTTHFLIRGGFRPFNFENTISTYGLGVVALTCTNNFMVVLGPCAQYCPSEASEQRMGQKPKKNV